MSEQQNLNDQAKTWLSTNVANHVIGGEANYTIGARSLWEWLGRPDANFRKWWSRARKRQKLENDKDFVCCTNSGTANAGRGGHNKKDYLLTQDAARRVVATDDSPKGRALLRALLDLADRIEGGDPQIAAFVNRRHREVHGTDAPGSPRRAWSERLEASFWKHKRLVSLQGQADENVGRGCWTVLTAIVGPMLALEDELLRHALPIDMTDRPDGSIGGCWANHRRSLGGLPRIETTARLEIPLSGGNLRITEPYVYPAKERALFEAWLESIYLPDKLPNYLRDKYSATFGRLPPASAADQVNLSLTGRPANLTQSVRAGLEQRSGVVHAVSGSETPRLQ